MQRKPKEDKVEINYICKLNKYTIMQINKTYQNNQGVFNILFTILYYSLLEYLLNLSMTKDGKFDYSAILSIFFLIIYFADSWAVYYKIGIIKHKMGQYETPSKFLIVPGLARPVIRMLLVMGSLQMFFRNTESTVWLVVVFFVVIIKEIISLSWIFTDNHNSIAPTKRKVFLMNFILYTVSCFCLFIVDKAFQDFDLNKNLAKGIEWSEVLPLLMLFFLLFIILYLPNRLIEFIEEWTTAKTKLKKFTYLLSVIAMFLIMLFLN